MCYPRYHLKLYSLIIIFHALAISGVRAQEFQASELQFSVLETMLAEDGYAYGIQFEYYEGFWFNLPNFDDFRPVSSGIIKNFDISIRQQDDYFGFRFNGYIKIASSGKYTFFSKSNDGSKLFIDDQQVVDNDGSHSTRERKGSIELSEGMHKISVLFFNSSGTHALEVRYEGPDFGKQLIPDDVLFHQSTSGFPMPWTNQDIGKVSAEGSVYYSNGVFVINGSGADIWEKQDEFHYVYWTANGDCELVSRVNSISNTNSWAKAGVMIRETLKDNSKHAFMMITPSSGVAFQRRISTGGASSHTAGNGSAPYWLKLQRIGNDFTGYVSPDGQRWNLIGSDKIDMSNDVYVGLAVTSHNDGTICTAQASFNLSGTYGEIQLIPENDVVPADGKSITSIHSNPLFNFYGDIASAGEFVTVESDMGSIASQDAATEIPGIQVVTNDDGTIRFDMQSGIEPGIGAIIAESAFGTGEGKTSIQFIGEDIDLITTESEQENVSIGQENIPVTMLVRNNGYTPSYVEDAGLLISNVSAISDEPIFTITRTDTITRIPPDDSQYFTFIVSISPQATAQTVAIDGYIATSIMKYTGVQQEQKWFLQTPPQLVADSIDALSDEVFQKQEGLLVRMQVTNHGMAIADNLFGGLHFQHKGQSVDAEYTVIPHAENPTLVEGDSTITMLFLVNIAENATLDSIRITGEISGNDVNSGQLIIGDATNAQDFWVVKKAEGLIFKAINISQRYAIAGQTKPIFIVVVVKNETGVVLNLDSTRIEFRIDDEDVTNEYSLIIPQPLQFIGSQSSILHVDGEDSLLIAMTEVGTTTGFMEITSTLFCHEQNLHFPIVATNSPGSGYMFINNPPELQVISTRIDSCFNIDNNGDAIVNEQQPFAVRIDIRNIGNEDIENIAITTTSNGASVQLSADSLLVPLIPKNQMATVYIKYRAHADNLPENERFHVQFLHAIGAKSGEPALLNVLSELEANIQIQHAALLTILADSIISIPVGKEFTLTAHVANPDGYADIDTSGELAVQLPTDYNFLDGIINKPFVQNQDVTWRIRAPETAKTNDLAVIYFDMRARDVNTRQYAAFTSYSFKGKIQVEESVIRIKSFEINSPDGAEDDTLSTGQPFEIQAFIQTHLMQHIIVSLRHPNNYDLLPTTRSGNDSLLECTWTIDAPEVPDYQAAPYVIQAYGNIENDTTIVYSQPDTLWITTVEKTRLSVGANITSTECVPIKQIHPGLEFIVHGWLTNNGDAHYYGETTPNLELVVDRGQYFTIVDSLVQPVNDNQAHWRIHASYELPRDNWSFGVRLQNPDSLFDSNSNEAVFVDTTDVDVQVTSATGVGRLELMVSQLKNVQQNMIVPGEKATILGLAFSNLSTSSEFPIIIKGLQMYTFNSSSEAVHPVDIMTHLEIRNKTKTLGQLSTFHNYSFYVPFSTPDTIHAQQSDSLFVDVTFHEQLTQPFSLALQDSSDVNATSYIDVFIVDENRHSDNGLNIRSHCPVLTKQNLKASFINYPNPFGTTSRPSTRFVYYLKKDTHVQFSIFTLLGELVWQRVYKEGSPQARKGLHQNDELVWDGTNMRKQIVLNGVYIAYIKTGYGETALTKVAVVK
ncbi:hypothetical protein JW960_13115 [candidate division KSB1 bacterium]|nr:hypothetical protein [candidate division KSB1 bacterium]